MSIYIDDNFDVSIFDPGDNPGCLPRQSKYGELACAKPCSESMPLIPESQWLDRIKDMTAKKLFIGDRLQFAPAAHYQNGLNYCWAYSLAQSKEAARAAMGLPFILLAPESVGESVSWRNAGNYLDVALAYDAEHGMCRRSFVPQHAINPAKFKDGWQEDCKNFVPLEWLDLDDADNIWAATVTALLSGMGCYVGYDWWGHAVFLDRLVLDGSKIGVHTPNSHGAGNDATMFGSRAVPSLGSFALGSMTYYKE